MGMNIFQKIKLNCVDLGARAGMSPHWMPYAGQLNVDAFEPDENAEDKGYRQIDNVSWFPVGLAGKTGRMPFYITSTPSGSSLYPPNPKQMRKYSYSTYWEVAEMRELDFYSFSDFIKKYDRPLPELIKLDTQGSELDILSSLDDDDWQNLIGVEAEVEFLDLYEGQPLFRDIDYFMSNRGFQLMDLRTHRSYRVKNDQRGGYLREFFNLAVFRHDFSAPLLAGDALYIRKYEDDCPPTRDGVIKLALVLSIYHFFDEAVALAEHAFELERLSEGEKSGLIASIVAAAPKPTTLQRGSSLIRKAVLGVRTIHNELTKLLGIKPHSRNAEIKGWSSRVWPDQ